jgi:hypothetical protein
MFEGGMSKEVQLPDAGFSVMLNLLGENDEQKHFTVRFIFLQNKRKFKDVTLKCSQKTDDIRCKSH